jgi:hypothetical protein
MVMMLFGHNMVKYENALATFAATILLALTVNTAEAQEYRFEIGGNAGTASYMGDLNKLNPILQPGATAGVVFRYNANFRMAAKGNIAWASIAGTTRTQDVLPGHTQTTFQRNIFEAAAQAEYNFFAYSDKFAYLNTKRFSPYMAVGTGITVAPGNAGTFAGLHLHLGAGAKYKVASRLNLGAELLVKKLFDDTLDVTNNENKILDDPYKVGGSIAKNKDWYLVFTLSLTWDFGLRCGTCNNAQQVF